MSRSVSVDPPFRVARSELGFRPLYHRNCVNHCPGCGHTQWYIGRISAECAFCATALPLQEVTTREARPVRNLGFASGRSVRLQPSL